jgi:hypothetical protein
VTRRRPGPVRIAELVAAGVLAGTVALAGCGGGSVTETKDGRVTVDGKGDKARVTISGERGAEVTYNQRTVPSDFPSAVPRPALDLQSATAATRDGKHYFQLTYRLGSASARRALGAYAEALTGAGFAVDSVDGPASETQPSPMRATGKGWRVVTIATSDPRPGTMLVTVDNA